MIVSDDFKPNCALIILDFLIRHGMIDPDTGACDNADDDYGGDNDDD